MSEPTELNSQELPRFEAWCAKRQDSVDMAHRDRLLVYRCTCGDEEAWQAICDMLTARQHVVRKFATEPTFVDEVLARTLARLATKDASGVLRIERFRGTAPLQGWLCAVLIREAIDMSRVAQRQKKKAAPLEDAVLVESNTVFTGLVRGEALPMVQAALRTALARMSPRERTWLRYRFVDGATLQQLAALMRVHRATAARTLAELQEQLRRDIQHVLLLERRVNQSDLLSMLREVVSAADGSLREALLSVNAPAK